MDALHLRKFSRLLTALSAAVAVSLCATATAQAACTLPGQKSGPRHSPRPACLADVLYAAPLWRLPAPNSCFCEAATAAAKRVPGVTSGSNQLSLKEVMLAGAAGLSRDAGTRFSCTIGKPCAPLPHRDPRHGGACYPSSAQPEASPMKHLNGRRRPAPRLVARFVAISWRDLAVSFGPILLISAAAIRDMKRPRTC